MHTKQAISKEKNTISIKDFAFVFELIQNHTGKAYKYEEFNQGKLNATNENHKQCFTAEDQREAAAAAWTSNEASRGDNEPLRGALGQGNTKRSQTGGVGLKRATSPEILKGADNDTDKRTDENKDSNNSSGQISQDNRIQARRETAGADTTQEGQQIKDGSYGVGTLCGSELVERSTCEGTNSTSINSLITKPRKTSEAFLKASLEKRKEAELKLRLVREYESRGKMTTKRFLKELSFLYESLQPSEGKLFRWVKAYREAIREDMNPLGKLLDSRGLSEKPKALSKEMMEDVARMLLENPDRRAKKIEKLCTGVKLLSTQL